MLGVDGEGAQGLDVAIGVDALHGAQLGEVRRGVGEGLREGAAHPVVDVLSLRHAKGDDLVEGRGEAGGQREGLRGDELLLDDEG